MPKRSCPFSESFSSQYKIHIGQKELSHHGVFGSKYRQEIYEKTKNLLFNGTKALMSRIWMVDGDSSGVEATGREGSQVVSSTLLRGQTVIGLDGRLKKTVRAPVAPGESALCGVCMKTAASRTPCARCERRVCLPCTRHCSSCAALNCSVCTVVDYSDRYDRVLCCDCSV